MSEEIRLLSSTHDRSAFSCGKELLDVYLRKQAKQDVRKKVAACFILSEDGIQVKGYYTLSTGSIPREQLPEEIRTKLPMYRDLPVTLLGRLAVHHADRGRGYGALLLIDALKRSLDASRSVGSMAVIVDPLDQEAYLFYAKYGFIELPGSGRMFLPMETIQDAFKN